MEQNIITLVFLPLALGIIMLGMGLSLVPADFKRIFLFPKAVITGLVNQIIILPVLAIILIGVFSLSAELAVGIMILAACPGGPTSNLLTNLAKGDVALSITLTAIASVITVFTIPFIVNMSLEYFMAADQVIQLPLGKTIAQIFIIMVLPVALGMFIKKKAPVFSMNSEKPVKIISAIFLFLIIAVAVLKGRENLVEYLIMAGPATLALNVFSLLIGYISSRILNLSHTQGLTISIESGIQNGTLAITIAVTLLNSTAMSIPPAIYSLLMFLTAGVILSLLKKKKDKLTEASVEV
jgi:bile acid:Na+ symporter, BASS family